MAEPYPPRFAVVGCVHGSLNQIYADVKAECEKRGWDTVDAVILGGDTQTLRNCNDATCIKMPDKYKKLGDFAHYYSGQLTAPYLTIFVGGNHEASNYLRELHYGGWACPNIYFLGAANVIRLGPVRISGMSGIWKGYDYRKPHSERLPYNNDDRGSIYHVREIDIRKLLQVRTQVDVGLSHDWIRGIEKFGDSKSLFRRKPFLREDSITGKLGNNAALQVVERLRPRYWLSAHLHVQFAATMPHDGVTLQKTDPTPGEPVEWAVVDVADSSTTHVPSTLAHSSAFTDLDGNLNTKVLHPDNLGLDATSTAPNAEMKAKSSAIGNEAERLAGWNNFQPMACKAEVDATLKLREELQQAGSRTMKAPETQWKRVTFHNGDRRVDPAVRMDAPSPTKKLKVENEEEIHLESSDDDRDAVGDDNTIRMDTSLLSERLKVQNEEEIDLGSSDDDLETAVPQKTLELRQDAKVQNNEEISLESSNESMSSAPRKTPQGVSTLAHADLNMEPVGLSEITDGTTESRSEVDQTLRNSLPASLSRPIASSPREVKMTHPPAIQNRFTRFLALDKPNNRDPYLQLVEIHPISDQGSLQYERPYHLQYDKEWLAITRVFAGDIRIGEPTVPVPANLGEEEYLRRILEQEQWVEENLVQKGLMDVPCNFEQSAPKYDPSVPITTSDQPLEYSNIQTTKFTELLQIPNPFKISEEEAIARHDAGPRPVNYRSFGGDRGPGHFYTWIFKTNLVQP
ncbi:DBR1-domain-containing protein [Penicillium maclennaniae]|uniref:DBR1-domain-containing protein n=1 Tax=Penicillium maclennaniae TaxID=1343394 RepID=UPI00254051E9|nr:DBR1-domain-containing protein [Penicillium maclennaniae]KAJ5674470.1 DBR1-domain-containing protein [Penicillium maclennaniae]